jgi:Uma2 family endonuclease
VSAMLFPVEASPLRRFSVKQYHALASAGVLTEDDRVELLDGLIVEMPPIGPPHAYSVEHGDKDVISPLLPKGWHVRMQQPITLATSEPEPDLAVVRGARERYRKRHPRAGDVVLAIEFADKTLRRDRAKASIYAAAEIPQYWIVDLVRGQVEVYRDPRRQGKDGVPAYSKKEVLKSRDELSFALNGKVVTIPVDQLVP